MPEVVQHGNKNKKYTTCPSCKTQFLVSHDGFWKVGVVDA